MSGRARGAGVRVVRGETTGYAHTADLSEAGLRAAADAAAATARDADAGATIVDLETRPTEPHEILVPPESVSKTRKVELLRTADAAARGRSDTISQVSAAYADSRRRILVANSDGLLAEDDQVRTRFMVQCVAVGDTGMQTGTEGPGRTMGFELFDEVDPEQVALTAADRALAMLRARPAPSGRMPSRPAAGCRWRVVPRSVWARSRVRPGRARRVGLPRPRRGAGRVAAGDDRRRRHLLQGVGDVRDRRRGNTGASQRADRGRRPHRLPVGPDACPQGGPLERRQRSQGDVPRPADGADDEHLSAGRRGRTRRHRGAHRARASTARPSAVAR